MQGLLLEVRPWRWARIFHQGAEFSRLLITRLGSWPGLRLRCPGRRPLLSAVAPRAWHHQRAFALRGASVSLLVRKSALV